MVPIYESMVNSQWKSQCWQRDKTVSPSHNKMSNWHNYRGNIICKLWRDFSQCNFEAIDDQPERLHDQPVFRAG